MSKLVLDTNVMVAEYRRVLGKPKFKLPTMDLENFFVFLDRQAATVVPGRHLHVSSDEADNRFLECAEAVSADYLVTGNKKHFPVQWKTTRIVNAREWLEDTLPF